MSTKTRYLLDRDSGNHFESHLFLQENPSVQKATNGEEGNASEKVSMTLFNIHLPNTCSRSIRWMTSLHIRIFVKIWCRQHYTEETISSQSVSDYVSNNRGRSFVVLFNNRWLPCWWGLISAMFGLGYSFDVVLVIQWFRKRKNNKSLCIIHFNWRRLTMLALR